MGCLQNLLLVERKEILGLIILIFQANLPTYTQNFKLMYSYESRVNTFKTESETALKILSAKQISFSIFPLYFHGIKFDCGPILIF